MPKIVLEAGDNLKKIVFTYDLDPDTPDDQRLTADGVGFKGRTCMKQTEKLMAGLNAKIKKQKLKPEYNVAEAQNKVTA
jgi:hypothetical protein